jgi:hypothetical protein
VIWGARPEVLALSSIQDSGFFFSAKRCPARPASPEPRTSFATVSPRIAVTTLPRIATGVSRAVSGAATCGRKRGSGVSSSVPGAYSPSARWPCAMAAPEAGASSSTVARSASRPSASIRASVMRVSAGRSTAPAGFGTRWTRIAAPAGSVPMLAKVTFDRGTVAVAPAEPTDMA